MSAGCKWTLEELIILLYEVTYQLQMYGKVSTQSILDANVLNRTLGAINGEVARIELAIRGCWRESDGIVRDRVPEKVNRRRIAANALRTFILSHGGKVKLSLDEITEIKQGDPRPRRAKSSSHEAENLIFYFEGLIDTTVIPITDKEKLIFLCNNPERMNNLFPYGRQSGKERKDLILEFGEKYIDDITPGRAKMINDIYEIVLKRMGKK